MSVRAGKDTLIAGAVAAHPGLRRIRRVITHLIAAGGEDFDAVAEAEFACRPDRGDFALHWRVHGLHSGIFNSRFAGTGDVIFNGSRAALPAAVAAFPDLRIILVTAPDDVRAARRAARGRESAAEIGARLGRTVFGLPYGIGATQVMNDGTPEQGIARLLSALQFVTAWQANRGKQSNEHRNRSCQCNPCAARRDDPRPDPDARRPRVGYRRWHCGSTGRRGLRGRPGDAGA